MNAPAESRDLIALAIYRCGLLTGLVLSLPLEIWERAAELPGIDPALKKSLEASAAAHRKLAGLEVFKSLVPQEVRT